jgi:hypothetical protein
MKTSGHNRIPRTSIGLSAKCGAFLLFVASVQQSVSLIHAQSSTPEGLTEKVRELADTLAKTQAQLQESQRNLDEMRQKLVELQQQIAQGEPAGEIPSAAAAAPNQPSGSSLASAESTASAYDDLRERQAVQESEIATQAQSKIESESKYPVKVTGMLLMNGFKNSEGVDSGADPSVTVGGAGNAGVSVRQTMLGFDARGPRIFGAGSFADLRVDFYGSQAANQPTTGYSGYYNANSALVRLRTAHAGLYWDRTQLSFALDRPIINPDSPTSLTAAALPPLAWSGNLWTWNPQALIKQNLPLSGSVGAQLQAGLIDVGDAPLTPAVGSSSSTPSIGLTSAEQSSKPGAEARIAIVESGSREALNHIGVGGYFAPHVTTLGRNFDSWAATLDARAQMIAGLEFSGNFYRGAGLGGLGGGTYKDFAYAPNPFTGGYYFRPLDDVGGWAQLKEKAGERLEFNAAYGMDEVVAGQLVRYYTEDGTTIQNLARNRTLTGNVIYSPSAYLLFSVEYRHLNSTAVEGSGNQSNIIGVGAGYKF